MTQPISFTDPPMDAPCARPGCHHDFDEHGPAPDAEEDVEWADNCRVPGCRCDAYTDEPPERDPDEARDRRRFG